ncbi:MAG: hypothetical protein WCI27_01050 [Candidatus Omnitrophota bacterium]
MSFMYDARNRRPQIWTYPFFILIMGALVYGFYVFGEKKSAGRVKLPQNTEDPDRRF